MQMLNEAHRVGEDGAGEQVGQAPKAARRVEAHAARVTLVGVHLALV